LKTVRSLPVGGLREALAHLDAELAPADEGQDEVEGVIIVTVTKGGAARVKTFGGIERAILAWAGAYLLKWATE
jgi:Mrp family chromosome partitioning ATPase